MNDEMTELARRAVACEGWRWMEGMSTTEGDIVVGVGDDTITLRDDGVMHAEHSGVLPDLNDPATLGCLLGLVREVLDSADFREAVGFCFGIHRKGKRSMIDDPGVAVEYLVAALEAADDR